MSYGIIYKCTNVLNDKIYIGQTTTALERRISRHLLKNRNDKGIFKKAINKYGKENFKWEIIDKAESKEELDNKEIYWIEFYNTLNHEFGYNLKTGGANGKPCQESINKMKESAKRNRDLLSDEEKKQKYGAHKIGTIPWIKGKHHSEETIKKFSKSLKGRKVWNTGLQLSKEHKENLSKSHKGIITWNKGISWNAEVRKKLNENSSHRILDEQITFGIKFINKYSIPERGYWSKVSKELNISQQAICDILHNRTWKFLQV